MNCDACPYLENQFVHDEEFQAWDVLMASLGQLRISPSGRAVGLDLTAVQTVIANRNYDAATVSELIQEAEVTLIPLLNETPEHHE